MKRIAIFAAIVLTLTTISFTLKAYLERNMNAANEKTDSQGHVLAGLWAEYDKYQSEDRPQKMAETLAKIKAEAAARRLAWDFYDAGTKYIDARTSRSWKDRDTLEKQFKAEVEAFDVPVVTYSYKMRTQDESVEDLLSFVNSNADRLKASHNGVFYNKDYRISRIIGDVLADFISTDYEFALWSLSDYFKTSNYPVNPAWTMLGEYIKDAYPNYACWEYEDLKSLSDGKKRLAELKNLARKYEGRAISFYPRADLLSAEFDSLSRKSGNEQEFKDFYSECKSFEKERNALAGDEKRIVRYCDRVASLVAHLESRELNVSADWDSLKICFRNIPYANVVMKNTADGKEVFSRRIDNPARRFYLYDTVKVALPPVDDGHYMIDAEYAKVTGRTSYEQYRLSLAQRRDSRGMAVYAADAKSGKPIADADLKLYKNGKNVASYDGFRFDGGFTPLPENIAQKINSSSSYFELAVSLKGDDGKLRSSQRLSVNRDSFTNTWRNTVISKRVNIYLDRSAFNPGDTLKFKGVLFSTDYVSRSSVYPADKPVTAEIFNSEGKKLHSVALKTNGFGSVAGEFAIPGGEKNGMFSLRIVTKDGYEGSRSFRVDEFVLPTFDLVFDRIDKIYLPGDKVRITGRITSYSGHSLSGAKITYKVNSYDRVFAEGVIDSGEDGTLEISFDSGKENHRYYNVTVTVTDETGETLSFDRSLSVSNNVNLNATIENAAEGEVDFIGKKTDFNYYYQPSAQIVTDEVLSVKFSLSAYYDRGSVPDAFIGYELKDNAGAVVRSGEVKAGEIEDIDLSAAASGLYKLSYYIGAKSFREGMAVQKKSLEFLKIRREDKALNAPVKHLLLPGETYVEEGGKISVLFGGADGQVWAIAEIFGENRQRLDVQLIELGGMRGDASSLREITFDYRKEYPDAVSFQVFFFKDSEYVSYNCQFHRRRRNFDLPLSFSSFEDRTYPASRYSFEIKTDPMVECLAAVFDKSTEKIYPNYWNTVTHGEYSVPVVYVNAVAGSGSDFVHFPRYANALEETVVVGYGARLRSMAVAKSAVKEEMVIEDAFAAPMSAEDSQAADLEKVRENFSNSLAFEPFLRSDRSGKIVLDFTTSDKLSTYIVALYAHDKKMRNAALRRETVVTIPVKVGLMQPQYLYSGDKYTLSASVASNSDVPVSGDLVLYQYDTRDYMNAEPVKVVSKKITVPAGKTASAAFVVDVPDSDLAAGSSGSASSGGAAEIGLKLVFVSASSDGGRSFSDGVFVTVPVYPARQVLTESHSAVLLAEADKDALIGQLRSSFVNTTHYGAEYSEISIIDMVKEALPSKVNPDGRDVLSLSEAYYVRKVAESLGAKIEADMGMDELFGKILACRNADGGFGWFEGMRSSPVITAVLLERFHKMDAAGLFDLGLLEKDGLPVAASVRYLDKSHLSYDLPYWCGWLSATQYLFVRSMYADVPFEFPKEMKTKEIADWKKNVREYLTPAKERGLNSYIMGKARRIMTLDNLLASDSGVALAKKWGISISAGGRMRNSLEKDMVSLLEYSVPHQRGGYYYPNAVMPFRGLLESEAYAHSLIAGLLSRYAAGGQKSSASSAAEVSDGIRLWLMLQKETQKWDTDPAFVDAVDAVLHGSEAVKATKVIVMSKRYEKPFAEIRAAGNGFTVSKHYYREYTDSTLKGNVIKRQEIRQGDRLRKGDRLIAEYKIWNEENRSFVKLTAPREAMLRPEQQLSGYYGWWLSPLRVNGWYSLSPQGYRNVKAAGTEYYFDSYPEENTVVTETFFVTQTGIFTAPVVEIESLYAPHYRANSSYFGTLMSE